MSLNNVFLVGQVVYVSTVHTKDAGQQGTPATVTAVVAVEKPDGTLVNPAPTASVSVSLGGVATVTWSTTVGTTTATAAGAWKFRVVTSGDLIDVYEGAFYVRSSQLV